MNEKTKEKYWVRFAKAFDKNLNENLLFIMVGGLISISPNFGWWLPMMVYFYLFCKMFWWDI